MYSSTKQRTWVRMLDELFTKLDFSGVQDWSEDLQQEAHDLMVEYQHLFTLNDLELGKTSKVKHEKSGGD